MAEGEGTLPPTINEKCLGEEEEFVDPTFIGSFIAVALALGILVSISQKKIKPVSGLPYTLLVFIAGAFLGIIRMVFGKPDGSEDTGLGQLGYSIDQWYKLEPEILFFMFLPPLLFASASSIEYHIFRRLIWQAILLATVGVLISALLTAFLAINFFGYNDTPETTWGFTEGMLFGSMFAATDPVAVVALLHELGAPETMSVMIEGESLLNDGVGFVLFLVFYEILSGREDYTAFDIVVKVGVASFGGLAIGLALGAMGIFALQAVWDDSTIAVTITVVIVWGTFFISELLEVSGVIGVVGLGLLWAALSNGYVKYDVNEEMHHFWHKVEYMANILVFIFAGVVVIETLFEFQDAYTVDGRDIVNLLILFFGLNIIRFIATFMLYIPLKNLGYGITVPRAIVVSYGGLRGAVGLIAGLILIGDCQCVPGQTPTELAPCLQPQTSNRMMFHMAGIVFLTLAINGTTTKYVVNYLKLDKQGQSARRVFQKAALRLHEHMDTVVESLKRHPHYRNADWVKVWHYLPILSETVLQERKKMGNVGRASMVVRQNLQKIDKERFVNEQESPEHELHDARELFLNIIKANYRKQFSQGSCSSWPNLQALIEAASRCEDTPGKPIDEWNQSIRKYLGNPSMYLKYCGPKGDALFFANLSESYDVATAFLRAHKTAISMFKSSASNFSSQIVQTVLNENEQMIQQALQYIEGIETEYPDISRAVKTNVAIQRLLQETEDHANEMFENAEIDEKDHHTILHEIEHSREELNKNKNKPIPAASQEELLRNSPIFNEVPMQLVATISQATRPMRFNQGDTILAYGRPCEAMYLITRGKVTVSFPSKGEPFVRTVGETIGTVEFVTGRPSIATVQCQTQVEVMEISFRALSGMMSTNKQFERNIFREAGILSLEYHYPQLQLASFDLLKNILPHIRVVARHPTGAPVTFKGGIAIVLRGQVVAEENGQSIMPLMTPFRPHGAMRFSDDARLMFVKEEAAVMIKRYSPYYGGQAQPAPMSQAFKQNSGNYSNYS